MLFKHLNNYATTYLRMGPSVWKVLSEDSRRQILLLLRERDMYPTEIAKYFDTTLAAVSTNLRILKDADLIKETREGQKKRYSINPKTSMEIKDFFDKMWGHSLNDLKEFVEEKSSKEKGHELERNE
jgi:DNA-binding transcriptional ArsR family regulator